ncbi:hypothetical protein [Chelativorans salis]|uniref:Uncharacterized protein n=1 Tax=Chelativorans salis TaxID=2978478 RepID=A0ABT2LMW2_9HYPH|nr:hypothetical protein [Chelativorans sp. EGI FJ00035]MCT7375910.1 hypothetical protein [Chelativorans sp. EGI FJ00035]
MARVPAFLAGLAASIAATIPPLSVQAADIVGIYAVEDTVCAHQSVRSVITHRFRHQVTHVPHLPNVGIAEFYGARLTRYQPATPNSPIERRYCAATVRLTDGRDRPIWYLIEYGQGFASMGDNVEFCIAGFDRWNVYNATCSVLR